jgi:outer membrane protein assembly factor BamD
MTRLSKQIPAKQILVVMILAAFLNVACTFKRKKYENPIAKDTQQPDKTLFDKAVKDIEHGRFEIARLTLNTLINTYDTSEYLAKAKLAVADSWYREGGTHGLAQAEAEYKDFILFYPAMEEAAESQKKICDIHFFQMDKADRDPNNALRAEQECRTLITQFPNSKFVPQTEQELRQIQEVLAEAEFQAGDFYHHRGANAAAANRLGGLVDQYPLYSRADLSLWEEADSFSKMGPRFRQKEGDTLAKIVKDYPLSPYADQARKKLLAFEMPVPEADPAAVARMKYEQENRTKEGMFHGVLNPFRGSPDVTMAAKSGSPTMTNPKASIPASIPTPAAQPGITDVTVAPVTDPTALERLPDARTTPAKEGSAATGTGATTSSESNTSSAGGAPASAATPANPKDAAASPASGSNAAASPAAPAPDQTTDKNGKKKNDKKSKRKKDTKSTSADSTKPDSTKPNSQNN